MARLCKSIVLLMLICCTGILLESVENPLFADEPYVIQGYRVPFEMQVPPGWIVDLGTGGEMVLVVFKPKSDEEAHLPYPYISATMEYGRMKNHKKPVDILDEHLMNHPDTTVASREWRSLENTDALMTRLSWSSPLGRVEAVKAFIDVDEHVLVISCASLASEFDIHEPLFMESLDSLRQKRPPEVDEPGSDGGGDMSDGGEIEEIY